MLGGVVHLSSFRLRDFRNYAKLDAEFCPGFHILMGDNAQGKTNVLEAVYLLATARSFRGVGGAQMIRQGRAGYFVGCEAVGATRSDIRLYWSAKERKLSLNNAPVKRLSDYLGTVRAVVFCSEDIHLVKGAARARRRFMDLLLCQTDPSYLRVLQRYATALKSRNALLKRYPVDEMALDAFSRELVALGSDIVARRQNLTPRLSPLARLAYRRISHDAEDPRIEYAPSVKKDFALELSQSRERERSQRTTVVGPHRDDFKLTLDGRSAGQFGSEGQKRTLAIALKIAQADYLSGLHGAPPILLIDDVMGELDLKRRSGLMPLLTRSNRAGGQIFMTCTERSWPEELAADATIWDVREGRIQRRQ